MADCCHYKNDESAGDGRRNPDDHPQRLEKDPTAMLWFSFFVGR